jgi:hypothetical protein
MLSLLFQVDLMSKWPFWIPFSDRYAACQNAWLQARFFAFLMQTSTVRNDTPARTLRPLEPHALEVMRWFDGFVAFSAQSLMLIEREIVSSRPAQ